MTFWLRRWMEQSRTPSAQAVPWLSAISCTSTWRAPVTSRSRKTVPLPKDAQRLVAGALEGVLEVRGGGDHADAAATATGGRLEHQRVADVARRLARASSRVSTAPRLHGATGTPTSSAISFEPILSPRRRMASALGPMKVTPCLSQRSTNAGSSATKPQPGHTASAPVSQQGPLEHGQVDVRPRRGGAEVVGEVGLAHEHRGGLARGVQGDRLDVLAPGGVELADGVQQPHGGLTAVDDRDATERHDIPLMLDA